jgi:hypothetical protein
VRLADIKPWSIYFIPNCAHTDPPKDKYAVIACIDKNPMGFLINSRITPWLQKHHGLLVCDPQIRASEHSFLKHDSFVDCQMIYEFFDWEIERKVGLISKQAKADILKAIHDCPSLERRYKKLILSNENYPGYEE